MKFFITGKNGQLAQEFCKKFDDSKQQYNAFSKQKLDISDFTLVREVIKAEKPDVILNCAAYNQVDAAELDSKLAFYINHKAVENLALIAKEYNIKLVHYSSDYVFGGDGKSELYVEDDIVHPINEYGKSKLAGETSIKKILDNFLIFRVSWVYGRGKQNFIYKLLQWEKNREYLEIADDEISVPTSADTIVNVTLKAVQKNLTGLYHLTNKGACSRYEWVKKIFEIKGIKKEIRPISKDIFNLPAKRPSFSAMASNKLDIDRGDWDKELERNL